MIPSKRREASGLKFIRIFIHFNRIESWYYRVGWNQDGMPVMRGRWDRSLNSMLVEYFLKNFRHSDNSFLIWQTFSRSSSLRLLKGNKKQEKFANSWKIKFLFVMTFWWSFFGFIIRSLSWQANSPWTDLKLSLISSEIKFLTFTLVGNVTALSKISFLTHKTYTSSNLHKFNFHSLETFLIWMLRY